MRNKKSEHQQVYYDLLKANKKVIENLIDNALSEEMLKAGLFSEK